MLSRSDLQNTQRWLQGAIMTAEDLEEAPRRVLPSRSLAPAERVSIYRGMYELRLREALETDYPLVSSFLGEELWEELAGMYLEEHPSRSYTLNRLGDHLPTFLDEIDGMPRAGFVRDLARYELLRTEVFDERECEPLTVADMWRTPSDEWECIRLVPVDALRLGSFRYPVHAFAKGQSAPRLKDTHLAIYRRNYRLYYLRVTKPAYRILNAFARGKPLGEALAGSRAPRGELFGWFQQWVGEGIFQRLETTSRTVA